MTHDVNAAIRGARRAGAKRITVKDSHGNSKNLLIEDLEPGTELISGSSGSWDGMMAGISSEYNYCMLIGYHAMSGTQHGMMDHTYTGRAHRLYINNLEIGEIGLAANTASSYNSKLCFISSDDKGCLEAKQYIAGIGVAEVKHSIGRYASRLIHPTVTGPMIEEGAFAALKNPPACIALPESFVVRLEVNRTEDADYAARIPGVTRIDGYNIEAQADTWQEAHRFALVMMEAGFLGLKLGD